MRDEIKGTGSYKLETRSQKTLQEVRRIKENINAVRKELSSLAEIRVKEMR